LAAALRRPRRNATRAIRRTPSIAPTAIPAFAPVDRPVSEGAGGVVFVFGDVCCGGGLVVVRDVMNELVGTDGVIDITITEGLSPALDGVGADHISLVLCSVAEDALMRRVWTTVPLGSANVGA
jgi:hypothetical protein